MKLKTLASKMLKDMVTEYHDSENQSFHLDFFSQNYPDISENKFCNALYLLSDDEFVSLLCGDGTVTYIILCPKAISIIEEDTLLKKGYDFVKEIKALIG